MHYSSIVLLLGFMAASTFHNGIKDAFGYFRYVLLGFAVLFICLEINMIACHSQMKAIGIQLSTVHLSRTDKVSESGQKAKLGQASAMNYKESFLCITVLKSVLSLIFMCQFCYSYELAERNYIDDGKIFDSDAKLSSSHVIFMTMIACGVTLFLQRSLELFFYACSIVQWASDRKNFKVASGKSSRSGKSTKSYSCSSSSDGSTEASHRCEDDLSSSQDKVVFD